MSLSFFSSGSSAEKSTPAISSFSAGRSEPDLAPPGHSMEKALYLGAGDSSMLLTWTGCSVTPTSPSVLGWESVSTVGVRADAPATLKSGYPDASGPLTHSWGFGQTFFPLLLKCLLTTPQTTYTVFKSDVLYQYQSTALTYGVLFQ